MKYTWLISYNAQIDGVPALGNITVDSTTSSEIGESDLPGIRREVAWACHQEGYLNIENVVILSIIPLPVRHPGAAHAN